MKQKILVTGPTGFVGKQVVSDLLSKDAELYLLVRKNSETRFVDNESVHIIEHESIEKYQGEGLPETLDSIVHLVAKAHVTENEANRPEYQRVNVEGTRNLLNIAREKSVSHFIYLSSIKVNGDVTEMNAFTEASSVDAQGVYAETKYQAEELVRAYSQEGTQEARRVSIVRPPLVYGKGVKANMAALIELVKLLPILPFGAIKNKRSLISVRNLSDFLMTLLFQQPEQPYSSETFLVSDKHAMSTTALCMSIANGLDKKVFMPPIPAGFLTLLTSALGFKKHWQKLTSSIVIQGGNPKKYFNWIAPYDTDEEIKLLVKELR